MIQELNRFWNPFILQLIKTLFLVLYLLWCLVGFTWVRRSSLLIRFLVRFFNFLRTTHSFGASGTPALTSRGVVEEDIAEFFDAAVKLSLNIKGDAKGSSYSILVWYL